MSQTILLLLVLPLFIYFFASHGGKIWILDVTFLYCSVYALYGALYGAYKIHGLMKYDIATKVSNNILCINRYNIQIKREKKVNVVAITVLVMLGVLYYATMKVTFVLWTFLICVFCVVGLVTYWTYKKYDKGIESVMRSLEEIRELREE